MKPLSQLKLAQTVPPTTREVVLVGEDESVNLVQIEFDHIWNRITRAQTRIGQGYHLGGKE